MSHTAPLFHKERHIKYWLRCLKTLLPTAYTALDANRMMVASFIVSALDILQVLDQHVDAEARKNYVDWIYSCQHPDGGFRGFDGTMIPPDATASATSTCVWDPANLAGTYFALSALLVLGDDLRRVHRRECLLWLQKLQLPDGSFAEVLNADKRPDGGQDVRYCFLATLVRRIVRSKELEIVSDVDLVKLQDFILHAQNYDGGIGKAAFYESHAGWTYCAASALAILNVLPKNAERTVRQTKDPEVPDSAIRQMIRWLCSRQNLSIAEDNVSDQDHALPQIPADTENEKTTETETGQASAEESRQQTLRTGGFNGRCNKPSDTCYSFWVGGALGALGQMQLIDAEANTRFLLQETQHLVGGFGKTPGDAPDILHSYFGLASLALSGHPDLRKLHPVFCISTEARARLDALPSIPGE